MSVWTDRDLLAHLDDLTTSLRDRTDAWVRQLREVERDVYARTVTERAGSKPT